MNWLGEWVAKQITGVDTVLDLGCGIMETIDGLPCKTILCVDIWKTYLEHTKKTHPTINLDVSKDLEKFLDDSYDVVICLDVLEHLEESRVNYVLDNIRRICRKKAIIFTPSEFTTNEDAAKNAWDLGECKHQFHKCLVTHEQLALRGFDLNNSNPDNGFLGVYTKK